MICLHAAHPGQVDCHQRNPTIKIPVSSSEPPGSTPGSHPSCIVRVEHHSLVVCWTKIYILAIQWSLDSLHGKENWQHLQRTEMEKEVISATNVLSQSGNLWPLDPQAYNTYVARVCKEGVHWRWMPGVRPSSSSYITCNCVQSIPSFPSYPWLQLGQARVY